MNIAEGGNAPVPVIQVKGEDKTMFPHSRND
jgi:hypothetical protein